MVTEHTLNQSLNLVLLHAGTSGLHRFHVCFSSYVGSALHELEFIGALQHAHLVNDGGGIDYDLRRMNRLSIQGAHSGNLTNDRVIEIAIDTQSIVKRVSTIEKILKFFVKRDYRKGFVGAEILFGAFHTGTPAIPDFAFGIAWADKECVM